MGLEEALDAARDHGPCGGPSDDYVAYVRAHPETWTAKDLVTVHEDDRYEWSQLFDRLGSFAEELYRTDASTAFERADPQNKQRLAELDEEARKKYAEYQRQLLAHELRETTE